MAEEDSWDADAFEADATIKKAAVLDKWEGEDEEEDVKDNWDDEEEEFKHEQQKTVSEAKNSEKKKLSDKIKEKDILERKKQEELKKRLQETQEIAELTAQEDLAEKLTEQNHQEEADLKLANVAFGISNSVAGIDAISPSSKDDFTEFEKLLKDKISPYEKSIHYSNFLESLFCDLCLSLEMEDLKKVSGSLTVLLSEKQKQEKQLKKGKNKKKVVPAGGFKAKMKDDLADYGEFDGGYAQDHEDFM